LLYRPRWLRGIEPLLVGDAEPSLPPTGASMAKWRSTGAGAHGARPIPGLRTVCPRQRQHAAAVGLALKRARWELSIARRSPCPVRMPANPSQSN